MLMAVMPGDAPTVWTIYNVLLGGATISVLCQ